LVAPFAGAWIETATAAVVALEDAVAPFAGAWIETSKLFDPDNRLDVAPFAGAWIETPAPGELVNDQQSRPSRARGLKPSCYAASSPCFVAPFAGAWIETAGTPMPGRFLSRALRGRVD